MWSNGYHIQPHTAQEQERSREENKLEGVGDRRHHFVEAPPCRGKPKWGNADFSLLLKIRCHGLDQVQTVVLGFLLTTKLGAAMFKMHLVAPR